MTNWKDELKKAIYYNNETEFLNILGQSEIQSELKQVNEWNHDESPLHWAADYGRTSMLIKLISIGMNINAYCVGSQNKFTALHSAVLSDKMECVRILIQNGADQTLTGNLNCETC